MRRASSSAHLLFQLSGRTALLGSVFGESPARRRARPHQADHATARLNEISGSDAVEGVRDGKSPVSSDARSAPIGSRCANEEVQGVAYIDRDLASSRPRARDGARAKGPLTA